MNKLTQNVITFPHIATHMLKVWYAMHIIAFCAATK